MGGMETREPQRLRIVAEAPGQYTGELQYRTEDGRWWRECDYGECDGTGHVHRYRKGDVLDKRG